MESEINSSPRRRFHPNQILLPGFLFGVGMILLAIILAGILRDQPIPEIWYPDTHIAREIGIGLAAGVVGIAIVWGLTLRLASLHNLRDTLLGILQFDQLRWWHALAFGLLAGIPEEILFRGALQPIIGVLLTGVLFGAFHAINRTYFVYASLAGLYLGLLVFWRGDLWAATVAHTVYDAGMFWLIRQYAKSR